MERAETQDLWSNVYVLSGDVLRRQEARIGRVEWYTHNGIHLLCVCFSFLAAHERRGNGRRGGREASLTRICFCVIKQLCTSHMPGSKNPCRLAEIVELCLVCGSDYLSIALQYHIACWEDIIKRCHGCTANKRRLISRCFLALQGELPYMYVVLSHGFLLDPPSAPRIQH